MAWNLLSRLIGGGKRVISGENSGAGAYVFKSDGYRTTRDGKTDIGWAPTAEALAKQVYAVGVRAGDLKNFVDAPGYVQKAVRERCLGATGLRVTDLGNLRKGLEDLAKGGTGEKKSGERPIEVREKPQRKNNSNS
jgi:hypothetical protein